MSILRLNPESDIKIVFPPVDILEATSNLVKDATMNICRKSNEPLEGLRVGDTYLTILTGNDVQVHVPIMDLVDYQPPYLYGYDKYGHMYIPIPEDIQTRTLRLNIELLKRIDMFFPH